MTFRFSEVRSLSKKPIAGSLDGQDVFQGFVFEPEGIGNRLRGYPALYDVDSPRQRRVAPDRFLQPQVRYLLDKRKGDVGKRVG